MKYRFRFVGGFWVVRNVIWPPNRGTLYTFKFTPKSLNLMLFNYQKGGCHLTYKGFFRYADYHFHYKRKFVEGKS